MNSKTTSPEKSLNKNAYSPKPDHPYASIINPWQDLESFSELSISQYTSSIIIKSKRIQNFIGFPQLQFLTQLVLDGNPIKSFEGATQLPNLKYLSIRKSPVSRLKYFKLMALVAFGTSILTINDMKTPDKYIEEARLIEPELRPELIKGRIVSNLKPLRLIDTNTNSYVSPNAELLKNSLNLGYSSPSDRELVEALTDSNCLPESLPSAAIICNEICVDDNVSLPENIVKLFSDELSNLRQKYNAEYIPTTHDYSNSTEDHNSLSFNEEEEIIQNEEDINELKNEEEINELQNEEEINELQNEEEINELQNEEEEINELKNEEEEINQNLNEIQEEEEDNDQQVNNDSHEGENKKEIVVVSKVENSNKDPDSIEVHMVIEEVENSNSAVSSSKNQKNNSSSETD